jgi:hypothetical protein
VRCSFGAAKTLQEIGTQISLFAEERPYGT